MQNDEFLRLVINSIKNDITCRNEAFQCLALNFVGSGEACSSAFQMKGPTCCCSTLSSIIPPQVIKGGDGWEQYRDEQYVVFIAVALAAECSSGMTCNSCKKPVMDDDAAQHSTKRHFLLQSA